MIEQVINDQNFTAQELGLLVWMYYAERFTTVDANSRFESEWHEDLEYAWNRFAAKGLLTETEEAGVFMLAIGPKKMSALEQQFEEFRKAFPGAKTGHATMLSRLRKHKDWKTVIPLLMESLEREKKHKQQLLATGKFCPEWKNLQTWLNNRCWELEYDVIMPQTDIPQAIKPTGRYGEYVNYMELTFKNIPYLLSFDQYEAWCSFTGNFVGLDRRFSESTRRSKFLQAHRELHEQPAMVSKGGGLLQRLIYLIQ